MGSNNNVESAGLKVSKAGLVASSILHLYEMHFVFLTSDGDSDGDDVPFEDFDEVFFDSY